ncbi:MAG: anaerobic ribonucleoside-triphosphate reductase activating protein [Mobiluncus porci]|uniref:Anaerobic ribonucleoside-triphosphate reductase activating protein n=1 Tax=Mobiluncus porci TaxID=2652278 RepID=A0A7K0K534_9ACTO|nr:MULTISPECIES: anaerobic ribonucleoside-triphosphate reductase activating protein [Mobiluncus]MCI6585142.1 anaerobic ribonucleoside-triphosphate reductase activating protein [Mobiluncus sp.]MDD7541758.1 anaerobic ribonucleoside-triphosphate reductase activating protein [Mobiluncus porci]MDY5748006.1 anaerobic ribonucleoside-triphosphate reductase activating protein [Mobiluncus porci]MST50549.1 anaerobic ribonucleoside-triphosphate reductase activating protein [Mobiluncus porci]
MHKDLTGLNIAGVTPFSSVDWPGKLVATAFLQGCPWNCGYCQNFAIIDPHMTGGYAEEDLWELLTRRQGLLDGVVFSGGEPTRQAALIPAAQRARELGFEIGLHSGGAYPKRLAELLDQVLLDWIGLDIKALPENYSWVAGLEKSGPQGTHLANQALGQKAWESLDLVLEAHLAGQLQDYEVRLTVYPGDDPRDTNPENALEIAKTLRSRGVETLAIQEARPDGTRPEFAKIYKTPQSQGFPAALAEVARTIQSLGFPHFTFRGSMELN